jgi:hypothetical protein
MTRSMCLWAAACACWLCGCSHEVYQVDMDVEGGVIVRSFSSHTVGGKGDFAAQLAASNAGGPTSQAAAQAPERLPAVATLYKVTPATSQPWKRGFVGRTPDDVGGAGQVEHFACEMGSAWIYLERFRGDDDPAAMLQERLRSADILASVIAGWARARLGDRKGFDKLGAYLDGEFRKDVRNLSLLLWAAGAVHHMSTLEGPAPAGRFSSAQLDVAAIAAQYLLERRYVSLEDAPAFLRLFGPASQQERFDFLRHQWRKFLTGKIGLEDKGLAEHLVGIFDRAEQTEESLETYVVGCKEYKEHAQRLTSPATRPDSGDAPGMDFVKALACLAFMAQGVDLWGTGDELTLTLASKEAPILTNGAWDAKAAAIRWHRQLGPADPLPAVCYALWARPDERWQRARLGRVILRDEALAAYCFWRKALPADQAAQWSAFLAGLTPQTATAQLAAFRAARAKIDNDRLSDRAAMLADALKPPSSPTTTSAPARMGGK